MSALCSTTLVVVSVFISNGCGIYSIEKQYLGQKKLSLCNSDIGNIKVINQGDKTVVRVSLEQIRCSEY